MSTSEFSDSKEGDLPLLCLFLSLAHSHTDGRREGAPLKQVSRSPNSSPPHKSYQRQTEQPTDSGSGANSPRHALKPPNGVLAQKNRDQDRDQDMDGVNNDTVPVVRIDTQGLLNGDAADMAKRAIMNEDSVDMPHAHIDQTEEQERKAPEQHDVVMNSIPEQKVRYFLLSERIGEACFVIIQQRSAQMLSVCVRVCLWSG